MSQVQKKKPLGTLGYLAQTLAGCITGFIISPFTVIVDKSVVEFASGKSNNIWSLAFNEAKHVVTKPHVFFPGFSFRWMYFVYAFTYSANNLGEHLNVTDSVSQPIQKLLFVFLTNTTCSLIKDKKYAQQFGSTAKRPFPVSALGFFFLRDIIAMAAAFTLPAMLARSISQKLNVSVSNGERIAQISLPVLQQFVAVPIHLMGLDLYNRPDVTLGERISYIRSIYFSTVGLRMLRFLPAYGFGGIANIELRKYFKKSFGEEI